MSSATGDNIVHENSVLPFHHKRVRDHENPSSFNNVENIPETEEIRNQDVQPQVEDNKENDVRVEVKRKCRFNCSKRSIITGTIFCIFFIAIITLYFVFQNEIQKYTDDYVNFMKDNKALGVFLFAIVYTVL